MKIPRGLTKIRKWQRPQDDHPQAALDARVVNAVERLAVFLELGASEGRTLNETIDAWDRAEAAQLRKQHGHALAIQLPWWNYLRNPVWAIAFAVQQHRLVRAGVQDAASLKKLDYLLGRAEFMLELSWYAEQGLREQIASGALTRWRAFSLVLSGAFSMTSEGDVRPRGIGKLGLALGTTLALQMGVAFVAFAVVMAVALATPCAQECIAIGASQLMVVTAVLGYNAWSFSWGRQRKATHLTQIFGESEG